MTIAPTILQSKLHRSKIIPAWPTGNTSPFGRPGGEGGPQHLLLFLIISCLAILLFGLWGCGINKATQRVLVNEAAFNKVGYTWAKLNPCVVDSIKTLVHDTTIKTDTAYTLPQNSPQKNTLVSGVTVYVRDTVLQTITKTITLHDSVKIVSVDKRLLNICNDSVTWYKLLFANYKTKADDQISSWKNKAVTRFWYLIGFLLLAALYLFRKPLLAAFGGLPTLLTKKI